MMLGQKMSNATGFPQATMPLEESVSIDVNVAPDRFLPWFVPRSPVGLFEKWGPMPGVSDVLEQTGAWTTPGSLRTLVLSDGSRITEQVLECRLPLLFRYRMTGFAGVMRPLLHAVDGHWQCEPRGEARVCVTWSYMFHPRGAIARLVLRAMVRSVWRGYMVANLKRVAAAAESERA